MFEPLCMFLVLSEGRVWNLWPFVFFREFFRCVHWCTWFNNYLDCKLQRYSKCFPKTSL